LRPRDGEAEAFDLRHHFSLPVSLNVDLLGYELRCVQAGNTEVRSRVEIPLLQYEQKEPVDIHH
jgi:hypothetical protein